MASSGDLKIAGCVAVLRLAGGDPAGARLVWADSPFFANFDAAKVGAPAFPAGVPEALAAAFRSLAEGDDTVVACAGTILCGHRVEDHLGVVALGGGNFLVAVPVAEEDESESEDARLAEILDALPVAVAVVGAVDGTILWMNDAFRDLLGGSEFDLMGTSLAGHFALPGAFKTLMGATGPITPSSPVPTALKTLAGTMTPVIANAKRVIFRREPAAMVSLTRGL
jgi:PAS domain-containing protein